MKIAQFIDTLNVGGAETMLVRLSVNLAQYGHEVTIYHFGNPYIHNSCEKHGLNQVIIPFVGLYKSLLTVYIFSLKFARLLKKHKIDLLHSHLYGSITGAYFGAFIYRIPHVGTLHDLYMVQERKGRGLVLRFTQAAGTQLVSVSQNMRGFYQSYIPFSKEIMNIYNGFKWEAEPKKNTAPDIQRKNSGTIRLVVVARLIKLKRHEWLVNSLAEIIKKQNVQLFFVGDGPEQDNINAAIKNLSLENKIFLLGERNDVHEILLTSDIFILPSESEGLSCSIIEAMSADLPCIVSNVGGNGELVSNEINGYVFDVDDINSLNNACNNLITHKDVREAMGAKGKERSENIFNLQSMTENYIKLYASFT